MRRYRAYLFAVRDLQIDMYLAADKRQGSAQQTVSTRMFCLSCETELTKTCSYVQELEARLLHMENLFTQVAPILEQVGHANGIDVAKLDPASGASTSVTPDPEILQSMLASTAANLNSRSRDSPSPVKLEDDMSESFGQLALDEHGQMRWIGSSSTMSLIQSFRSLTSVPLHRVSPMEEDPLAPGPSVNKLYFPASVFFGKVRALPGPEEVEYPPRDLADKLVSVRLIM